MPGEALCCCGERPCASTASVFNHICAQQATGYYCCNSRFLSDQQQLPIRIHASNGKMCCVDAVRDNGSSSESKSESGTSNSSSARPFLGHPHPYSHPRPVAPAAYLGPARRPDKQVMMKPASHSVRSLPLYPYPLPLPPCSPSHLLTPLCPATTAGLCAFSASLPLSCTCLATSCLSQLQCMASDRVLLLHAVPCCCSRRQHVA